MSEPPQRTLDVLIAVVEGHYGAEHTILTGDDAERVRCAYCRYWIECGRPDSELHRCLARSIYASEGIQLWFLRPELAALLGKLEKMIDPPFFDGA